jgi:hypothetical protein
MTCKSPASSTRTGRVAYCRWPVLLLATVDSALTGYPLQQRAHDLLDRHLLVTLSRRALGVIE